MTVAELKKKFPVVRGRDHGDRKRLGDIVALIAKALEAKASPDSTADVAADVIDRELLFGAWGDRWEDRDFDLLRDIRGLVIAAYRAGKASAHESWIR